jgi:cysteine-rich repeat protein
VALCAGLVGCNELAGIRLGVFNPCVEDAGDPVCDAGEPSPSSSGSAGATTGGGGGSRALCGNGALDKEEECDDGNPGAGDGCTQCSVDCDEPGAFKVPASAHCYWALPKAMSFFESSVKCQYQGGRLASVTSAPELSHIDSGVSGPVWIGASALAPTGTFQWLDGEPWDFEAWSGNKPQVKDKDLCVVLDGEPLLFGASDCALMRKALCERVPAVGP